MTSAILLAAGRGERMRPLTEKIPKPLVPVHGKPLIVHHIEKLAHANIKNIVINISYLADQIKEALGDGSQWKVTITYSYEPDALETGGGIFQALPYLGDKPFLVISSDIYTDYDFDNLIRRGEACLASTCTHAHLVLVPNPSYHPTGDFSLKPNGLLANELRYTYANMALLSPALFKNCEYGKFKLAPLLRAAVERQQATGELYLGKWWNIGTIDEWKRLSDTSIL